jgi:hypothetical protein
MLFFYEICTTDSYRIISYGIESYESNGFRKKIFLGSYFYTNPLKIL